MVFSQTNPLHGVDKDILWAAKQHERLLNATCFPRVKLIDREKDQIVSFTNVDRSTWSRFVSELPCGGYDCYYINETVCFPYFVCGKCITYYIPLKYIDSLACKYVMEFNAETYSKGYLNDRQRLYLLLWVIDSVYRDSVNYLRYIPNSIKCPIESTYGED